MVKTWSTRAVAESGATLTSVAVDTRGNQLIVRVDQSDFANDIRGRQLESAIEEELALSVVVEFEESQQADACTGRENCWDPDFHAGAVTRRGSTTGTNRCTMGFHVTPVGSTNRMYLTSGHCGFSGSNDWYHAGYTGGSPVGKIGSELGTSYRTNGFDAMRVDLPNSRVSYTLYSTSPIAYYVQNTRGSIQGEAIWGSMGVANTVDLGVVADASVSWNYPASQGVGDYLVIGADADDITGGGGNSGSPLFFIVNSSLEVRAVGLWAASTGKYARIMDVLTDQGLSLYTCGC
jgi:hypothetical protein